MRSCACITKCPNPIHVMETIVWIEGGDVSSDLSLQ